MKKKILIVDDEKISLMMTNHILMTEYDTVCASSGAEALYIYEKERPDLVLSDFRMPQMNGFELQRKIQEQFEDPVPFIFMTADHDEENESVGLQQGAVDFIHKPFRADVLLKRISNILRLIEQISGLKKASATDPMTGLLNKASVRAEISELCKRTPGALLMVDLDSFKPVNDLYGHSMGDKILIRFAEILQSAVRFTDITGRIGGDEFIAYCQNVGEESVIAEKAAYINEFLLQSAHEMMGEDMSIPLGASIGCVFVPDEGKDFDTLFKKADEALYHVKKNGKHGYEIYGSNTGAKIIKEHQATGIAHVFEILSERSEVKGAYTLPFEQFRTVYQFLSRLHLNYKKEIWVVMFSLHQTGTTALPTEEVMEQFLGVIGKSLRASDIVTQNSKNQILAVLNETNRMNSELVVERVLKNWEKAGEDTGYQITYELDTIKG
ncbi:MAG: diguanylate cyclase [Lachnospiraceae bacterium]|nr:diguanylate cyclase [Lachnospiraceae bacterium]